MQTESVDILIEEQHFLVVNKPAGLFSQARADIPSVQSVMAESLKQRDQHTGTPFIGLPHRLDRWTSGVMLLARNQRALKRFGEQFQSRKVGKYYLAVLDGLVATESEQWCDCVAKVEGEARARIVKPGDETGREARLNLKVIAKFATQSLVLIQLHTGRMHQIRIQAASRGVPVAGDSIYGEQEDCEAQVAQAKQSTLDFSDAAPHMALHALRLEFRHPKTAKLTAATAPLPAHWHVLAGDFSTELEQIASKSHATTSVTWQAL